MITFFLCLACFFAGGVSSDLEQLILPRHKVTIARTNFCLMVWFFIVLCLFLLLPDHAHH